MENDAILFGEHLETPLEVLGRTVKASRQLDVVRNRTGLEQRANEFVVKTASFHDGCRLHSRSSR
jgi:hypothetical protein